MIVGGVQSDGDDVKFFMQCTMFSLNYRMAGDKKINLSGLV